MINKGGSSIGISMHVVEASIPCAEKGVGMRDQAPACLKMTLTRM